MKKIHLLLVLVACAFSIAHAQPSLSFKNERFKIVQFTDMHWSQRSEKCAESVATMRSVLASERPDLTILTGDIVTEAPAAEGWTSIVNLFEELRMPFVVTMGNHDAECLSKDSIYDLLLRSAYYVGSKGNEGLTGYGNCALPVYDSKGKGQVASVLYCIDSNDYPPVKKYGHYDWIHHNQIAWYRGQSEHFADNNGGKPVPSLAFIHIPLVEYNQVIDNGTMLGLNLEGGVASASVNSGLFASFIDRQDVMGVFAGHDHQNDYIGLRYEIALAYGRVTGADAYGDLERGGRVIELYEGKPKFDTWICTPSGREAVYYYPSGLTSLDEQTMPYLPPTNASPQKHGVAYSYYEGNFKSVDRIASTPKKSTGTMPNFDIKEAPVQDYFAYDFSSLIKIPEKGVYRFYTFSDDGSKLFIDDKLVVDNDGGHSVRRAEGKIALDAGYHKIRLLYFESYMGQELEVGFSGRNIPEQIISDEMLYLPR